MILGIVGSEEAKFTIDTRREAYKKITEVIDKYKPNKVVSGACHLGGIDVWAIDIAREKGIQTQDFPPKVLKWLEGYKPRNIEIAEESDVVICITLKELPFEYKGMRFMLCYHCGTNDHVKSGGCWTMRYAKKIGKDTELIVI